MALGRREDAIKEAEQAIHAVPGDLDARLILAETSAKGGDTAAAREHLKAIEEPSWSDLGIKLVGGLIDLNGTGPTRPCRVGRGPPADRRRRRGADLGLAQVLLQLGRVREAEPLLNHTVAWSAATTRLPEYRYLVALAMVKTGGSPRRSPRWRRSATRSTRPLESQLNYLMGQAYEQTRDPAKALASYRQAGELSRRWNAPWLAIARLEGPTHPDPAVAALQRGLADSPDDPSLLANLAQACGGARCSSRRATRLVGLRVRRRRGKRTAPGAVDLVLVQADYLNAVGKPEDAQALLAAASKQSPDAVGIWLARANLPLPPRPGRRGALGVLDRASAAAGEHTPFGHHARFLLISKGRVKAAARPGRGRRPRPGRLERPGDLEGAGRVLSEPERRGQRPPHTIADGRG